MDSTIKEITAILRSTETMAVQFVERVQERIGQPVSHAEILTAMQKVPAKKLSLEKVVSKVKEGQKKARRRASKRRRTGQTQSRPRASANEAEATTSPTTQPKEPKTMLEKLGFVLQKNWDRAQAEGLNPNRMSAEAFINAVYRYSDRREATRRRILRAAKKLDQGDVLLTPALVADAVHELFEG